MTDILEAQPLVEPYDQLGAKCPHALGALRWFDAATIRCMHCGRRFIFVPYGRKPA
jgi:hypothetical protein